MSREGDWICGSCTHQNFKRRESCMRCGNPKFGGGNSVCSYGISSAGLPGDWYCNVINCAAHNYASRESCYRCGAPKFRDSDSGYGSGGGLPGWKTGDWICTRVGCGAHNYASRMECFKCATPRNLILGSLMIEHVSLSFSGG
ncbi:hypothetical protein NMG60_11005748 [Bertholletia excelsa]